jgi:sortase (surface protein transpeptidase)
MSKRSKWLLLGGLLLLLCSLGLFLFEQISAHMAQNATADMVARLEQILPPRSTGVMDTYSSMQMPAMEVDGADVIGLLDIPAHDVALPIGAAWETKTRTSFPRRFSGTVYDGSLIIGGYDQKGQFDCLKKLDVGDAVSVTDMTGAEFTYVVQQIERKSSVQAEVLADESSELTLFARNAYSMEYIVVRCVQV